MPSSSPNVYLFYGADDYKIAQSAKSLVDFLVPESERDLALEIFDGAVETVDAAVAVIRQATEAIKTTSMFGGNKTVWIRNLTFLKAKRLEKSDLLDDMMEYLRKVMSEEIPEGHTLVISGEGIPGNSGLANTANKLAQQKKAQVVVFEAPKTWNSVKDAEIFVAEYAQSKNISLPPETCRALVARAGTDSRFLASEVEKLAVYAGDTAPTPKDVLAVVTLNQSAEAWDLQDAFGMRNLPEAVSVLRRLLSIGTPPMMLIIQLENRVNDLLIINDSVARKFASAGHGFQWNASSLPPEVADSAASLGKRWDPAQKHSFVVGKLAEQSRKFKRIELRKARQVFMKAHENMVSSSVDSEAILELALVESLTF